MRLDCCPSSNLGMVLCQLASAFYLAFCKLVAVRQQHSQRLSQWVQGQSLAQGPLSLQLDKRWSLVEHKGMQQWVWLALAVVSRELVGAFPWGSFQASCSSVVSLGASDRAAMRCALYWCDLELHPSLQRTTASASIALC